MSEPTTVFGPLTEEEQRTAEEEKQRIIENRNQAATRDDIDAEFSYYWFVSSLNVNKSVREIILSNLQPTFPHIGSFYA